MIIVEGGEDNVSKLFSNLSKQIDATWNNEELYAENKHGYFNLISYQYLNDCYINVGEANSKSDIYFKNSERKENRIVLRIMRKGISALLNGEKQGDKSEILLYNSNQDLDFMIKKDSHVDWIALIFPPKLFDLFFGDNESFELRTLINKEEPWLMHFTITPQLESAIRTIFEIKSNRMLRKSMFFSRIVEILGLLRLKLDEIKYGVTINKSNDDLNKMIDLKTKMLSDYTKAPKLKELTNKMNMSESSLQRAFKDIFHMPIIQFFNQNRLEEAHRQIKYSDKSITEISIDLGFTHIHHLSSAFKKQYGYSPKSLRR